ncbi:hypothetical protein HYS92_01700 [Candidatus Daviesbacteria bacterium]|nr:hypothetical protein [Candidatus Daviesbacteria bacterium]
MFTTFKERLLLGLYIFLILSIPLGAYLASQAQKFKSQADEVKQETLPQGTPKPIGSAKKELLDLTETKTVTDLPSPSPTPDIASTTIATSFGPTLSLKTKLEGRPESDQSTKMFVGIVEGIISNAPKYLLSFSIDLTTSGEYAGLSLAGLTPGSTYSALLKGQTQLAKGVSFTMSPNVTKLNSDEFVTLLTGDLNEDNTINSTDLSIIKSALGSSSSSSNYNKSADFNLDGVVNIIDYTILLRNFSKTGDSGVWQSTPEASSSASLKDNSAIGGPQSDGHWIWVPNINQY